MTVYTKNGLVISKMSGKMDGFYSINTNPFDNPFCNQMSKRRDTVCSRCYSRNMLRTSRMSCNDAWSRNSRILSDAVFSPDDIPDLSPWHCNGAFRFSAHGEIINDTHFINLCLVAAHNSDVTFGWWTKRVDVVQRLHRHVPSNVVFVASCSEINPMSFPVPSRFHRTFNVYTADYVKEHGIDINCIGKCAECMVCYRHNGERRVNEIVK